MEKCLKHTSIHGLWLLLMILLASSVIHAHIISGNYRKRCLWSKGEADKRGRNLVAWEDACKSKAQGGLGIIDIQGQNEAPLLKHLDKFYNKAEVPWVTLTWSKFYSNEHTPLQARTPVGSFWWKDVLKLFSRFSEIAIYNPGKGDTVRFWYNVWVNPNMQEKYPQLFSFTRKPKCSLRFFLHNELDRLFTPTLSAIATAQLEEIDALIANSSWDEQANDQWLYSWGSTSYSSKKAYCRLWQHANSPIFRWLWASSNTGNHKFFFWLLLRDRLNTRNLLRRKNMHLQDYSYVLCDLNTEETCFHLFFGCPFSRDCWSLITIHWDLSLPPVDMLLQARANFNNSIFKEIVITGCWAIWVTRNGIIFDNAQGTLQSWKRRFLQELDLVCIKSKPIKKAKIIAWRVSIT